MLFISTSQEIHLFDIHGPAPLEREDSGATSGCKKKSNFFFRGRHLCSLTLLSAPPHKTILVGPAHCNLLCKDNDFEVELCCCRPTESGNSCKEVTKNFMIMSKIVSPLQTSSYCGRDPQPVAIKPEELQVETRSNFG